MSEKPLHVQVGEALGWTDTYAGILARIVPESNEWCGYPPGHDGSRRRSLTTVEGSGFTIPRYDTDWSVTGPLIEKYGFRVFPDEGHGSFWVAHRADGRPRRKARAMTALEAVCALIVTLAAEGHLVPYMPHNDGSPWER